MARIIRTVLNWLCLLLSVFASVCVALLLSDVYCDRRLSPEARQHEVLLGECLGGALAVNDFVRLAQQVRCPH